MMKDTKKIKELDTNGLIYYSVTHPELYRLDQKFLRKKIDNIKENFLFQESFRLLEFNKNDFFLEVGGGRCETSIIFADNVSEAHCLDKNSDELCGLNAARKIAKIFNKEIYYHLEDYNQTSFCNNFFNKIYGKATLHHSYDINQTIKEMHRILKPGV